MVKFFCDHCGGKIANIKERYEIDERDFPDVAYMKVKKFFNKVLCEKCYYQRLQLLLDFDTAYFEKSQK